MKNYCLLLLSALVLSGCGIPTQDAILGVWYRDTDTLEFRADGSWYVTLPNQEHPVWGTWKLNQEEQLVMGYGNPPLPQYERIHSFSVSEDELIIKDYEGVIRVDPKPATPAHSEEEAAEDDGHGEAPAPEPEADAHGAPKLVSDEGTDMVQLYIYTRTPPVAHSETSAHATPEHH